MGNKSGYNNGENKAWGPSGGKWAECRSVFWPDGIVRKASHHLFLLVHVCWWRLMLPSLTLR